MKNLTCCSATCLRYWEHDGHARHLPRTRAVCKAREPYCDDVLACPCGGTIFGNLKVWLESLFEDGASLIPSRVIIFVFVFVFNFVISWLDDAHGVAAQRSHSSPTTEHMLDRIDHNGELWSLLDVVNTEDERNVDLPVRAVRVPVLGLRELLA